MRVEPQRGKKVISPKDLAVGDATSSTSCVKTPENPCPVLRGFVPLRDHPSISTDACYR